MDSRMAPNKAMARQRLQVILFSCGLALALASGCSHRPGQLSPGIDPAYTDRVELHDLAAQLGLQVVKSDDFAATLRNGANTVMVFADPGGSVFVNGQKLTLDGGVARSGSRFLLPREALGAIRSQLRPVQTAQIPRPRQRPRPANLGAVVIDAGHGGRDPGAVANGKTYEKDINLQIASLVAQRLKAVGVAVHMTRDDDTYVENPSRAALANRVKAALFVSHHANAVNENYRGPAINGYEIYVHPRASAQSRAAAEAISQSLRTAGIQPQGTSLPREKDLLVLRETTGPAVLVEVGYMTDARELVLITSASYQKKVADAVSRGIVEYLEGQVAQSGSPAGSTR